MTPAAPTAADDVRSMDRQALVDAILDLEHDRASTLEDAQLAQELGDHVKPYVDELATLRSGAAGGDDGPRRRGKAPRGGKGADRLGADLPAGPAPRLASQPPGEQARWIFMERYIPLEKHEEVLGLTYPPETFAEYQEAFDRLIKDLLLLPRSLEALEKNDVAGLQRVFAACVPIFRSPVIGDEVGGSVPSSLASLRQSYPAYFYKRRKKPNWFEAQDFHSEAVPGPRWVLAALDYMNCTLRRPERKLAGYAKDWDLPPEYAHHKNIVEDVYDRIVVGQALGEDLFAGNCNSLSATRYRNRNRGAKRLVYTIQKVHKITIHGKTGIPHWRATRRLWPGVFPSLSFPDAAQVTRR